MGLIPSEQLSLFRRYRFQMLHRRTITWLISSSLALGTPGCGCIVPSVRYGESGREFNSGVDYDETGACGSNGCEGGEQVCKDLPPYSPPLPGWAEKWKKYRELPEAQLHPRFHPLPTRPMFQPAAPMIQAQAVGTSEKPSKFGCFDLSPNSPSHPAPTPIGPGSSSSR